MKNSFGNSIAVTLFGESHGEYIGAVLDGMPSGVKIDLDFIKKELEKRHSIAEFSTKRQEKDEFKIISGVKNGFTIGTPICFLIENRDKRSEDYNDTSFVLRPSHADFVNFVKNGSFADTCGGGHSSGRITAALVAVGAVCLLLLKNYGITVGTHIYDIGGIKDREFNDIEKDINKLNGEAFAVLDETAKEKMSEKIKQVKEDGDSIGGILETAVIGIKPGFGEPWFDTVEGLISHAVFSIPAVKGIEFGKGFSFAHSLGSEVNDEYYIKDNEINLKTNNCGGITGGITNGNPIIFRTAFKPTPSIKKPQNTVNIKTKTETTLSIKGRHDPLIVHRARAVVDSVTALVLADILSADGFFKV